VAHLAVRILRAAAPRVCTPIHQRRQSGARIPGAGVPLVLPVCSVGYNGPARRPLPATEGGGLPTRHSVGIPLSGRRSPQHLAPRSPRLRATPAAIGSSARHGRIFGAIQLPWLGRSPHRRNKKPDSPKTGSRALLASQIRVICARRWLPRQPADCTARRCHLAGSYRHIPQTTSFLLEPSRTGVCQRRRRLRDPSPSRCVNATHCCYNPQSPGKFNPNSGKFRRDLARRRFPTPSPKSADATPTTTPPARQGSR